LGLTDPRHLLRDLAAPVLGILLRRYRDLPGCEDAVQEALLAAARQWPDQGTPDRPIGWLVRVATRRLTDQVRAETARRLREQLVVSLVPADEQIALAADAERPEDADDSLELLFLCCHPALSTGSQVALTLRAVGGLTTAEIARAFLVPESTMAQRISRAKQTLKQEGVGFGPLTSEERTSRLGAVRQVLHLVFNEGYAASSGTEVVRTDLSDEAIRLTRMLARSVPDDPEVTGLLALMRLTDARRLARTGPNGELVPLDEQDRSQWDRAAIAEGAALVEQALARGAVGPFQVQAAIAALHDEAPSTASTDWRQILGLYDLLLRLTDNPLVSLNRAVALAMVEGPSAGLRALEDLADDPRLSSSHRLDAVRGHLLERAGDHAAAVELFRRAAARTASTAERDYLLVKAAR